MKKPLFPYILFLSLLIVCGVITFFAASITSVTKYTNPRDMINPFPMALQLATGELQVVTADQLQQLQLPDPENGSRMTPQFLLDAPFFENNIMLTKAIPGKEITNGHAIHIPTDYTAQISGKQLDSATQEITITYVTGAEEDQIITAIYTVQHGEISPKIQFVKQVLIWKTIFMNGMMISLILAFFICKKIMRHRVHKTISSP